MDAFFAKAKHYETQFDRSLSQYKCMRDAEEKLHIPKVFIALGGALILFAVAYFNIAGELFTDLIGWVYPGMKSIRFAQVKMLITTILTYLVAYASVSTCCTSSQSLQHVMLTTFSSSNLLKS